MIVTIYSAADIYGFARAAGFSPDQAVTMTAIALAESGGNSRAHNASGEDSRGLWQINMDAHRQWAGTEAFNPAVNAQYAFEVSRHGQDISPWSVTHGFDDARYLDYRMAAQRAAIDAGDGSGLGNWQGTAGFGDTVAAGAGAGGDDAAVAMLPETTQQFLNAALAQSGDSYVYGAEARTGETDPTAFDCSELTEWAAAQAGVTIPDGAAAQFEALRTQGEEISVDDALRTPGALLFHADSTGYVDHVAISLGDGRTIEARNSEAGVGVFEDGGNWMNRAAVLPGLSAPVGSGAAGLSTLMVGSGGPGGVDSDRDGLTDQLEQMLGTSASEIDTDLDGASDSYELLKLGTDPLGGDTDQDGLPDLFEVAKGFDPTNPDSAGTGRLDSELDEPDVEDLDDDGLSDALERALGTGADLVDSDNDGLTDGAEHRAGLDPLAPDDAAALFGGAGGSGTGLGDGAGAGDGAGSGDGSGPGFGPGYGGGADPNGFDGSFPT